MLDHSSPFVFLRNFTRKYNQIFRFSCFLQIRDGGTESSAARRLWVFKVTSLLQTQTVVCLLASYGSLIYKCNRFSVIGVFGRSKMEVRFRPIGGVAEGNNVIIWCNHVDLLGPKWRVGHLECLIRESLFNDISKRRQDWLSGFVPLSTDWVSLNAENPISTLFIIVQFLEITYDT